MSSYSEKVFPRGGKNPALSIKPSKTSFSLFKKKSSKIKKKTKKKKVLGIDNSRSKTSKKKDFKSRPEEGIVIKFIDDLNPTVLHEGLLVLGIVSQVSEKYVNVSLPGGMTGIVKMANVSQLYKDLVLQASSDYCVPSLTDLFKVGDILPSTVLSISEDDKRKFFVSLDPKSINNKLNSMEAGMVLVGTVKSEEDHGYIIDFGIKGVNGFLNFEKIENGIALPVGKLVRCAVLKCLNSQGLSNVELSTLEKDVKNAYLSFDSTCPIHSYVPGLQFKLTVTRILKNGLEVVYNKNKSSKGFIYEDYLPDLFPKLSNIGIGTEYIGTLLYIKPLLNVPHFKIISWEPENWIYPYGRIVKGKVVKASRSGVTFQIGKNLLPMKCFVPFVKLADSEKLIAEELDVNALYPVDRVVDKIRLKKIDYMKRCYIGDTDKKSLEEKYFSVTDISCGDIVPCKITEIGQSYIYVKIGYISGMVPHVEATDIPIKNPGTRFKVGQKKMGRVTDVDYKTRYVRLTMKPTLLDKEVNVLKSYSDAKKNEWYMGTVQFVGTDKITVRFFNGIFGRVYKKDTPYHSEPSLADHYVLGQLLKCFILSVVGTNIKLSLIPPQQVNYKFKPGENYESTIDNICDNGLMISISLNGNDTVMGMVPVELLVDYPGLGKAVKRTYKKNQRLTVCFILQERGKLPIFSVSKEIFQFYQVLENGITNIESLLRIGEVYPFLVRTLESDKVTLFSLLPSFSYVFTVGKNYVSDKPLEMSTLSIRKYQIVYGKILRINGRAVEVSLRLSDVWDKNFRTSLALLDVYLDYIKMIINHDRKKKEKYIRNVRLGMKVSGTVRKKEDDVIYELDAVLKENTGDTVVTGNVVWIKAENKGICVNTKSSDVSEIQDEEFDLVNIVHRAKIVYIGEEVIVAVLKGKGNGKLVFLPRKRHINDFQNAGCPYVLGFIANVWVERGELNNLIAIDREVMLLEKKKIWNSYEDKLKNSINLLKRKHSLERSDHKIPKLIDENDKDMEIIHERLSEKIKEEKYANSDDDIQCDYVSCTTNGHIQENEIKQEVEDLDEYLDQSMITNPMDDNETFIKSENESSENDNEKNKDIYSKERIFLSSSSESESDDDDNIKTEIGGTKDLDVGFNWDVLNKRELLSGVNEKPNEESSSEDEEDITNKKKKRVKMTKSEREEKAKAEEERLRLIEERLIRSDVEPETADDFDRCLLGNPNSSALWMKYMAFHLQATEIEKARAVARRALKTISFNEEQEKLNVWLALLNLENLYGNEDSLKKTIEEAVMCNEPYYVHLHVLNMNGQSGKFQDMERVGNMLLKKFKDVENLWQDVGLAYYKVGKLEFARQVLQRALSVLEKNRHLPLIARFAQMENKYGSRERAQTLYETILASFPKRVDVWSCYVDMLVKSDLLDLARQVLERATSQRLPAKKMKILFKKFLAFEEKYGTPENVDKVRQAAVDYVESVGNIN